MRLTKFTDYALRVLLYAAARDGRRATIEQAATEFGISRAHLKKVVLHLSHAGYVKGLRGHSGGFVLARDPADINLGVLIRQTEPDFGLFECFLPGNVCILSRRCTLPGIANEALAAFLAVFERYTLADVLIRPALFEGVVPGLPQPLRGPGGSLDKAS
jgi:Rrf2 family nitric oxide-sensitive transcriptional repressor